ncbi:ROK family protein [Kitasatospora sp. NA04385]|uniref:ROK family transcriptional regulator n=1 Tax=Kitasatospora sp. NA04385 TaxID=2742135 RepID=UPI0015925C5B|nr:ROK family protein [Kitasatospora sp. NA04385]QKW18318.1 ROK family protein [Kitasatospora sp. NA04385]
MVVEEGAGGPALLRRLNTAAVLRAIRDAGAPVRIAELVEAARLTRPTVKQALGDLLSTGWIAEDRDPSRAGPGRPAVRYALAPRAMPVLGVDLGPHRLSVAVGDLTGDQLALVRRRTDPDDVLGCLDEAIDTALARAGLSITDVCEIVAACPGIVDSERGSLRFAPSLPGPPDLVDHLRARAGCPVRLENDANMAALVCAAGHPGQTLVVVHWGERLGAGIVVGGKLLRGANSAAGEIGVAPTGGDRITFDRQGRGPLEREIGARGIVALARTAALADTSSRLAAGPLTPEAVFEAAAAGDRAAAAVVETVARTFMTVLAPILLALDPDQLIIGGGLARAGEALLEALRPQLELMTLSPPALRLSPLAEQGTLAGAVQLARDEVWRRCLAEPTPTES